MTALHSIPPAAPSLTVSHGLLYTPMQDVFFALGGAIIAFACLWLLPGQFRESVKALWAPVCAFLSRLCCPWLWKGVFIAGRFLCVLVPIRPGQWGDWPNPDGEDEQLLRLAFLGFRTPILT
jgi:hypothetical protein